MGGQRHGRRGDLGSGLGSVTCRGLVVGICDCVGLEFVYYNRIVAGRVTFPTPNETVFDMA